MKKSDGLTWQADKKKLDIIFSRYIRQRGSMSEVNQCFTCGNYFHLSRLQCGHYITRNHYSVRWDDRNCQPQCIGCNMYGGGKPQKFALKLKEKYGEGILEELELKQNLPAEINKHNIGATIEYYKSQYEKLLKGAA